MVEVRLPGKIEEIIPEAVYQGTAYEKTIRFQLENGVEVDLFDGIQAVNQEQAGDVVELTVSIRPQGRFESASESELGISPAENPLSKWAYQLHGKVAAVDPEDIWFRRKHDNLVVLDIGLGVVLVKPKKSIETQILNRELSVGEVVSVTASRTDIIRADKIVRN